MNAAATILSLVQSVTKSWAKQRKAEERHDIARMRRYEAMTRSYKESTKDVAWDVMEAAYLKASSNGELPAHARQIMYAARGEILKRTGRQKLDDQYFTQTLLPNYINEHPEAAGWNVVFDARGHFREPHTDRIVPLGTLDVQEYLEDVETGGKNGTGLDVVLPRAGLYPTLGPYNRYGGILFIEKEGFMPLFEEVRLAERFDIAIMSTKGMTVTASRLLVDSLSARCDCLPIFVLHDFDKSGFSILGTLQRSTRRYTFTHKLKVINLGLGLDDVKAYGLEPEDVSYGNSDPTWNLKDNGATEAEIAFLRGKHGRGQRVELNAFTSRDLVGWIETKLKRHGVKKVIPDWGRVLDGALERAFEIEILNQEISKMREAVRERAQKEAAGVKGLRRKVQIRLKKDPRLSWDEAVAEEAKQRLEKGKEMRRQLKGKDSSGEVIMPAPEKVPTLEDLEEAAGIDKKTSLLWQAKAEVPAADVERWISEQEAKGEELTTEAFLRMARGLKRKRRKK